MIDTIKSLPDIWIKMPSEHHARRFLEGLIWAGKRTCPHCDSERSTELFGASVRDGLYQCKDCRRQFTITTKTPLHGTKLDLRIWITAIFKVLTSSKGISSVVMARELGVNQKTAWKMGHAIRELMDDRNLELAPLDEVVEVDEAYIGGAPKTMFNANVKAEQEGKPLVLVAVTRDGQARAEVVPDKSKATLGPLVASWVDAWNTMLMTDGSSSYDEVGQTMADHSKVIHSRKQYADPETGAHVNTAEAFISQVVRAQIGVYHTLGRKHLQRYLNEILWRWNHRIPAAEKSVVKFNKSRTQARIKTTTIWKPIPVVDQMRLLFQGAVGKQMRRSTDFGICWPPTTAN